MKMSSTDLAQDVVGDGFERHHHLVPEKRRTAAHSRSSRVFQRR
jgi:hypothetical protein